MAGTSGSPFIGDAGPSFDPEVAAEAAAAAPEPTPLRALDGGATLAIELDWQEDQVRTILKAKGHAVHVLAGVGERDWEYTEGDLAAIAPPLTRILNRYDVTRAAAGTGDELAVLIGFGGYTARSIRERREVLAAIAEAEPVPVTGVRADPGTGPPAPPVEGETFTSREVAAMPTPEPEVRPWTTTQTPG